MPQLRSGFTLVELLVVITIISLMSMIGMTSFKDFSEKQITIRAQGQVQTLLRLTQSNATTSTKCNIDPSTSWSIRFDTKTIILHCEPGNIDYRTYDLQNAEIDKITCGNSTTANLPFTITYLTGSGLITISDSSCANASSWTIIIKNLKNTTLLKRLTISKGGTINVE